MGKHHLFLRFFLWIALISTVFFAKDPLFAQPITSLSLDNAINRALGTGEEITLAQGGVRSAQGSEEVAFSGYLPQVSASANYTRTFLSQYSSLQSLPDTGSAAALAGLFKNLPFGRANAWTLALSASENIFTGGRLTALHEAAEARKKSADIDLTAAQAQLILNVTQSYYDAVLADTVVKIAHDALDEAQKVYGLTNQAYQVGEKAEFDALSAKVARDNQIPVVLQSEDNRAQAYYRLKQLLNYPLDDSLELTTPIVDSQARFEMMSDTTTEIRSSVVQAKLNLDASNDQVKAAEASHWPQISISSTYSPVAYPTNVFPSWSDWYNNWTAALNISVPIYTGGNIEGNVNIAEGGVEQANARLEQAREAAAMDARTSLNALHSAEANLRSSSSTAQEAHRAYDIASVRFQQGISTEVELENSRIQEEQARENWASAVRNYQVARAKLALLKDLPINPAQAQVAASTAQSGVTQQQASSPSQSSFTAPSSGSPSSMPASQ